MRPPQSHCPLICLSLVATVGFLALLGAGCGNRDGQSTGRPSRSVTCDKLNGNYYDPKAASCVHPTTKHQALVLNAYRRVQELADTTSTEGAYAVYPVRYLTAAEAELLWADLRAHGARALLIAAELPGGVVYDPQSAPDGTVPPSPTSGARSWGGRDAAQHLLWHDWSDAPSSTVAGMVLNVLAREELLRPRPQLREAVVIDSDYRIGELGVSASPRVVLEFWNRHLDEVEAIQPKIDQLDKLAPTLGPVKPLSEGR